MYRSISFSLALLLAIPIIFTTHIPWSHCATLYGQINRLLEPVFEAKPDFITKIQFHGDPTILLQGENASSSSYIRLMRVNHAIPNDDYNNSYFRNHFVHTSIDYPSIWIADLKHTYVDPFKIGRDQLFAFCRRNFRSVWRTPPQNSTSTWPDIIERRFATEVNEYENLRDEDDDNITQIFNEAVYASYHLYQLDPNAFMQRSQPEEYIVANVVLLLTGDDDLKLFGCGVQMPADRTYWRASLLKSMGLHVHGSITFTTIRILDQQLSMNCTTPDGSIIEECSVYIKMTRMLVDLTMQPASSPAIATNDVQPKEYSHQHQHRKCFHWRIVEENGVNNGDDKLETADEVIVKKQHVANGVFPVPNMLNESKRDLPFLLENCGGKQRYVIEFIILEEEEPLTKSTDYRCAANGNVEFGGIWKAAASKSHYHSIPLEIFKMPSNY